MRRSLWFSLLFGSIVARTPVQDQPIAIPQGIDLAQFDLVGLGPDSISIRDHEIQLSGKPLGYFSTRKSYRNYDLGFEWKYDRPKGLRDDAEFRGNSGVLLHLSGPPKVWPRSIQIQLAQADPGSIFAMSGGSFEGQIDTEAQIKAIRPVGQWNRVEVRCHEGTISSVLNGVEISRGVKAVPDQGPIGWQSEGQPIRFRSIQIKPLP